MIYFTIDTDEWKIDITVIHYHHQKPDEYADNYDDYYGYTELEYTIDRGFLYYNGNPYKISIEDAVDIADQNEQYIKNEIQRRIGNNESFGGHICGSNSMPVSHLWAV